MYSFDVVGSYERETFRAGGTAASMLQPLLDNQVCVSRAYDNSRTQDKLTNVQPKSVISGQMPMYFSSIFKKLMCKHFNCYDKLWLVHSNEMFSLSYILHPTLTASILFCY